MKKLAFLLVFLVSCSMTASASYIRLQTTLTTKVTDNILKVSVSAVNQGDEPAYNVQAMVQVGEKKILGQKMQELGVNRIYAAQASFNLSHKKPGEHPIVIAMHYADANLYPFSALTCQTFNYKAEDLPIEIIGSMPSTSLWKKGKVRLTLKNLGKSEKAVLTRLVAPRELTAAEEAVEISLPPRAVVHLDFEIENFSALEGSTYQVYAISEYEKSNLRQTSITPGIVKIVETRTIFGLSYNLILGLLAVLVLFFVVAQFLTKRK